MIEQFGRNVPSSLHALSGSVFYSGRAAFSGPRELYILGLNPGGDPDKQSGDTIERQIRLAVGGTPEHWSAYCDESWNTKAPGTSTLQRRLRHVFSGIGIDLRRTPSSNLIFVRSKRKATLVGGFNALADACWSFHREVIAQLNVRLVVCLGISTGMEVCRRTGALRKIDEFAEQNARGWISSVHENGQGLRVASLAHPSIADWTAPATDPTPLIARLIPSKHQRSGSS